MIDYIMNINDLTKKELIDIINGMSDILQGKTLTHKKVKKRLNHDK